MSDVIVVGAGITGLACAWRLRRLGFDPLILEGTARAGGVIATHRINGYLVEHGPNTMLPSPENFAILDEAGLTPQIVEGERRAPRYICIGRSLRRAPFGPMSITGMLRAAAEPFIRSRSPANESIHDFFVRRFGREAEERLVSPFVTGIYAGDTRELSIAATFPNPVRYERERGSVILGMLRSKKPKTGRRGHTSSFRDGMEVLPRRLARDAHIIYGAANIRVQGNGSLTWSGAAAGDAEARAIVLAPPADAAAGMLSPEMDNIKRLLEKVDYAPMVIAASSVPDAAFPKPLRGFGFLVPRTEKLHLLGTLFSSALFPGRAPQGRQLLTSFIGGALERDVLNWSDERLWETVQSELRTILKISPAPEPVCLIRHARAIPQYKIGHEQWAALLKQQIREQRGLFLTGNYIDGVSVSACIESGERTAREVAAYLGGKS